MAKRISDTQRIINFATLAIETLTAIRANRYPKDAPKRKAKDKKQGDLLDGATK